jgi:colicin import membrane protein
MTMDRPMSAFMLSATLHGVVIALLLLLGYAAKQQVKDMPRVLELVAGGGDNLSARVAPKLGVENGVKLSVPPQPKAEAPKAEAPKMEPVPLQPPPPAPVKKAETVTPTKAPETKAPNFKQQIANRVRQAENKAKKEIAKERKAEEKRLAEEKKRELAKMTKADFDRLNKMKSAAKTPTKIERVTTEGITQGVADGSVENKTGGQGGKALVSNNDDEQLVWDTMFKERMRREFEPPPGMSDTLVAKVEVTCNADGSLTGARIARSSGSRDFDNAILEAIRRVRLPAKPDKRTEKIQFDFTAKEQEN